MTTDKAEVIQVIRTTLMRRGKGITNDPMRIITQFWSLGGQLLAEVDPANTPSPSQTRALEAAEETSSD